MKNERNRENPIVAINKDFMVFMLSGLVAYFLFSLLTFLFHVKIVLSDVLNVYYSILGLALFALFVFRRKYNLWITFFQFVITLAILLLVSYFLLLKFDFLPFLVAPFLAVFLKLGLDYMVQRLRKSF